jgi:hypothetical protein
MKIGDLYEHLILKGLPRDEVVDIVNMCADEAIVAVAAPLALELGLRWLHDRSISQRFTRRPAYGRDPSGRW